MSAPADTRDQSTAFALLDLIQGSVITQESALRDDARIPARHRSKIAGNAIGPDGALFVIEYVLPGGNALHIGNIIDLWLLLMRQLGRFRLSRPNPFGGRRDQE